jgi:hypothetical protein
MVKPMPVADKAKAALAMASFHRVGDAGRTRTGRTEEVVKRQLAAVIHTQMVIASVKSCWLTWSQPWGYRRQNGIARRVQAAPCGVARPASKRPHQS